jgi:hypothetical protein
MNELLDMKDIAGYTQEYLEWKKIFLHIKKISLDIHIDIHSKIATLETNVPEDVNTEVTSRHYWFRVRPKPEVDQSVVDSRLSSGFHTKVICKEPSKRVLKMLPTGPLDDSAVCYAKPLMTTPKKKNPHDTANSFENTKIYRS